MATADLSNPILSSPYVAPEAHFELGPGGPTGTVLPGRRPSESFIPIAQTRKGKAEGEQEAFDFDATGERREENSLINDVRRQVELWRARSYPWVTPMSRKLLQHWADPSREDRMLFCQREAAETAIYLAEVAGRHGEPDYRTRLGEQNALHNDALPRLALKMATGSGKTVVMAMLIAWQTINKVTSPRDTRFAKKFLVVTPGITIRDRLRVLLPAEEVNYYRERDLVPPDLWPMLLEAQVVITNYHAFQLRDAPEIKGVASNTRKILNAGKAVDPFKETEADMVTRVLRSFSGRTGRTATGAGGSSGEIVVFNDEAHHCYQDKLLDDTVDAVGEKVDREGKTRNADARVWFKGLRAVAAKVGIKQIYDLSATPFYLKGSGYYEGFIFPWVVSDFSLMDAIESGIVKVPRVPVDDDAAGEQVTYLRLWDHIDKELPSKLSKEREAEIRAKGWVPPRALEGALESLHRSYRTRFEQWEQTLADLGEPPPVLIVVCPNTTVSRLVYDWIAGLDVEVEGAEGEATSIARPGHLELLTNVVDGEWLPRPRTIIIDSAALESGESMKDDFKKAAGKELDAFKAEVRLRNGPLDAEKLTDEDLLREVMNTVGKKGKLGEQVRCVVSVSMLTEGWDANTVSHILGVRAFRSQLLCEQVVGRGLRRRSYAPNEHDRFEPEYADVYGVPFAFIPGDGSQKGPDQPPRSSTLVEALPEREHLAITFPKLEGYRIEMPDEWRYEDFDDSARLHVTRDELAVWTRNAPIAGQAEDVDIEDYRNARPQQVAFELAAELVRSFYTAYEADRRPWLFPRLAELAKRWLDECVTFGSDAFVGLLLPAQNRHAAAEKLCGVLLNQEGNRSEVLLPRFTFGGDGSTAEVNFLTRKVVIPATKSHVSGVVLDGIKGNTWEEGMAAILETHSEVHSFVKNDQLGFRVPYLHQGRSHSYIPDFLVRLVDQGDGLDRTLIVEVSGSQKSPGPTKAKADTCRDQWCVAVNNHGGWGRWAYLELGDPASFGPMLNTAIKTLAQPVPALGDPALV